MNNVPAAMEEMDRAIEKLGTEALDQPDADFFVE